MYMVWWESPPVRNMEGDLIDIGRTVAITPNKAKAYPWAEVRRINETCPMEGLKAMCKASPAKPFRFLYMSGSAAVRDPSRKPLIYGDYSVSRVSNR